MAGDNMARWSVMVSKETDLALRSFLGARGGRKGDLSKFIEEAVRWRMLDESMQQAREGFADLSADELQNLVDEAVTAVRLARPSPGSTDT
ncbi:ribbon-helix-helix domain-containing protein [Aquincola tertiaricarbonis]|uniref:Ribbon-helix-helix domain-containing protein n=1 Tax=Aquincola tertiaricarbonis TaxID=391953 RepID=A0ABY4SBM8_AQUTE|nr:ribbon-helix-helix domain-containing protein [Aquincola tertiaricarbonis]URI09482.1 ribbon-helix-helix domain-containing protein [Aquincola tertiaricarbonis]